MKVSMQKWDREQRPKSIYYFKNQSKTHVSVVHEIVSLIWLKLLGYDASLHTPSMRSMWEHQLVQSPLFLHSSNLTKGLQRTRLQICILDSIRTCILICHTRTPGIGRREMPLLLRVGCSHLGVGAADVAQRMMLAQSQYLDSYQPVGLDKWQPHFPGTLKQQKTT